MGGLNKYPSLESSKSIHNIEKKVDPDLQEILKNKKINHNLDKIENKITTKTNLNLTKISLGDPLDNSYKQPNFLKYEKTAITVPFIEGGYVHPNLINTRSDLNKFISYIKRKGKEQISKLKSTFNFYENIGYISTATLGAIFIKALKEEFNETFSLSKIKQGILDFRNGYIERGIGKILKFLSKKFVPGKIASFLLKIRGKLKPILKKLVKLSKVKVRHTNKEKGGLHFGEVFLERKNGKGKVSRIGVKYYYVTADDGQRYIYVTDLGVNHRYFRRMGIGKKLITYIKRNIAIKKGDSITLVNEAKDIRTGTILRNYYKKQGFKNLNGKTETWIRKYGKINFF